MLFYFTGSMIMYEPSEECVIDFWRKGTVKKLPVRSSNPRFIKAASLLRNSCTDRNTCFRALSDDYKLLFSREGLSSTQPYESSFAATGDEGIKIYDKLVFFYKSYEWGSRTQYKIQDDHLGLILLFLTRMVDRFINLEDNPSISEMQKEILRFIDLHLLSWLHKWENAVQENARSMCYKGISSLIYACTEDIYNIFENH